MVYDFQVVIDSADPERLARFWVQALGYAEEPPPPGYDSWEAALVEWKVPQEDWNMMAAAVPPDYDAGTGAGPRPRLLFIKVPEGKVVKNRLHLDIRMGDRSTPRDERWSRAVARAAELERLGATKLREMDEGVQGRWIVMQDPEGNEFCLT
jgi:hypothetical protein